MEINLQDMTLQWLMNIMPTVLIEAKEGKHYMH